MDRQPFLIPSLPSLLFSPPSHPYTPTRRSPLSSMPVRSTRPARRLDFSPRTNSSSSSTASDSDTFESSDTSIEFCDSDFDEPWASPVLNGSSQGWTKHAAVSSSSSSAYSDEGDSDTDICLDRLGKSSVRLLDQLEVIANGLSPPRTSSRYTSRDDPRSPVSKLPRRRQGQIYEQASNTTLNARRANERNPWDSTDIASLDIDDILTAFEELEAKRKVDMVELEAQRKLDSAVAGWREARQIREATRTPPRSPRSASRVADGARLFAPRSPTVAPRRAPIPSAAVAAVPRSRAAPNLLSVNDFFGAKPTTNIFPSVFPSRKKSLETSSRSTSFPHSLAQSAPLPTFTKSSSSPNLYPFLSSPSQPTFDRRQTPPSPAPSDLTRSSTNSSGSFRWSVASGSTNATIPEDDEYGSSPRESCNFFPSRSGSLARSRRSPTSGEVGIEDFVRERFLESPCEADEIAVTHFVRAPSSPPSNSSTVKASTRPSRVTGAVEPLTKPPKIRKSKSSSHRPKIVRPPPTVPVRSASLTSFSLRKE
ncbi:hypothetical protein P7C70_g5910, partial [Phenoliferia sp. Uapishka_3]